MGMPRRVDLDRWAPSLTQLDKWLRAEHPTASRLWLNRLLSNDQTRVEAAVAEAVVWDHLLSRTCSVDLIEDHKTPGVDFEFSSNGQRFRVEVTNLSSAAVSRASGLADAPPSGGARNYALLTKRIRAKVRSKLRQARYSAEYPTLIAVTTLHEQASRACVNRTAVEFAMGSTPAITYDYDPESGEAIGEAYQSTDLRESVFLSPNPILGADGRPIIKAKFEPISGFLLGGFGLDPSAVRVFGALNPAAKRPFDPLLLTDVPFCELSPWPVTDSIQFQWTITAADEAESSRRASERRLRKAGLGHMVDAIREDLKNSQ